MAASMLQNSRQILNRLSTQDTSHILQHTRTYFRTRYRGLRPELARSWKQRKADIEQKDPELDMTVNIGFPIKSVPKKMTRTDLRKMKLERNLEELERKSRLRELVVPIEKVQAEGFEGLGQRSVHGLAEHYGIYRDLFGEAYFYPQLQLGVGYDVAEEDDMVNPVFHGNILTPAETKTVATVTYPAQTDKHYTLCMTAPDSHLEDNSKEYIHWMIGNIPGSDMSKGETIFDYLPLFPVQGTGYHRYVFTLYQHDNKVNFSEQSVSPNSTSLAERTFETLEFYRKYQDEITPVGLCFFQAEWDNTVRDTFHNTLDMNEPKFEFLPPLEYIPKQKLWPIREPFNVYMDRYRDVKDIGEEVLKEKLKLADPFKPRPAKKKYPNLVRLGPEIPSWLKSKMIEKRNRKSYWKDLDD